MPLTIDQLIQKYAVTPGQGITAPLQFNAQTMGNHRVLPLIDGHHFFSEVEKEIDQLLSQGKANRFFYLSAWWLGLLQFRGKIQVEGLAIPGVSEGKWTFENPRFPNDLDSPDYPEFSLPGGRDFLTRLADLAKAGVDVRVMGWASPFITLQKLAMEQQGIASLNFHTLLSVDALRGLIGQERVLVNTLAHSLGGVHCKLVVCGDQTQMRAYTSGLDPVINRYESVDSSGGWHDAGVCIEGPAAGAIQQFFREMWLEQLKRPVEQFMLNGKEIVTHQPNWPQPLARDPIALPPNTGKQYVQVLRTVPQMNFNQAGPRRRGELLLEGFSTPVKTAAGFILNQTRFNRAPLGFAPQGLFEFRQALYQAISVAEEYIFIADQSLYALELMNWIRERMFQRPSLKVILFYGADPADPPNSFLKEAIDHYLIDKLRKDGQGQPKNLVFYNWDSRVVHAKVTLIDDTWCAVGSANCMRRSLYTDMEVSVGVLEAPTPEAELPADGVESVNPPAFGKKPPSFVQQLRRDLWAHYCGIPLQDNQRSATEELTFTELLKLSQALPIWDTAWGQPRSGFARLADLRPEIHKIDLRNGFPPGSPPAPAFSQRDYDLQDPDSRQAF